MPIPEDILKQMKCCLSDDGHIVIEPIVLKCGSNACKQCANNSNESMFKCFKCMEYHEINFLLNAPKNKKVESLIHSFLPDLFKDLKNKLNSTAELLKGLLFFFFQFFTDENFNFFFQFL
jgi:hypothetical protein